MAFGEIELYDFAEVPKLMKAARGACSNYRRGMLKIFAGYRVQPIKRGVTRRVTRVPTVGPSG